MSCFASADDQPIATQPEPQLSLETSPRHRFSDWPNSFGAEVAAGVYTIWEHSRLIYVGMAGQGPDGRGYQRPGRAANGERPMDSAQFACVRPEKWRSVLCVRVRPVRRAAFVG